MKKSKYKVGDIFSVNLANDRKKHFQYIGNDLTQLNSEVIRAFSKDYGIKETPSLYDITNDDIDFHAHCVLNFGVKFGFWNKIGSIKSKEILDIMFRDSEDYGNPEINISEKWWVWKVNEEQKFVGKLIGEDVISEIGIVISPDSIVYRIQNGKYNFVYPGYE